MTVSFAHIDVKGAPGFCLIGTPQYWKSLRAKKKINWNILDYDVKQQRIY